ncbi:MAG: tetratricopeptide repeat protein [Halobacteriota archaeon]
MTNLDELEDLLRKDEKEKAYELIKEDRGITAEILMNEGINFGIIGEYDLSIAYFELTEKIAEDYNTKERVRESLVIAYYNRGNAYHKLNRYEEAIEDYSKALELNPNLADAYNNRGAAYFKLNKHEKVIEDCNKAIELSPNLAEAYNNRGAAYRELNRYEEAVEDYSKAIELNPNPAKPYANRGITRLQTNEDLDKAIEDFKCASDFFEGKDKEKMLGFVEWAKARKKMNMKNWDAFRERMNEAREIFEKINDPLSLPFAASIKFSYLDEELDNALNIPDPIKALEEIETALKNLPEVKGLIDPEATIFGARILSFAILSEFISSMRSIDENTDLKGVKDKLAELLEYSKEAEEAFEAVDFNKGKTAIVDIQEIIGSAKHEIEKIKWAANKKQKALEILKNYWSRLGPAIRMMNGISTREIENITLGREIKELRAITSEGFEKSSEEHKEILERIYETENILMQKDVVNARYRIEFPPSPSPAKIIVDIPFGKLTEEQIEEKAEEIAYKFKYLRGKVKEEFLEAIKRIPEIGSKLLKRLKVRVPRGT